MMHTQNPENHFRVIRFYTDFSAGVVREVVATGLTLEEARDLAEEGWEDGVPGEDTVIEDELKDGLDAIVEQ